MTYAFRTYAGLCTQATPSSHMRTLYKVVFIVLLSYNRPIMLVHSCVHVLPANLSVHKPVYMYTLYRAQSISCVQTTQTFPICMYKPAGFSLILAGLLHLVCYI